MTEELWDQMLDALAVFKRGVVRKAADSDDHPPADQAPHEPSPAPE